MKNDKKQEVRSSSILGLLGLVSFSLVIIATPWNQQGKNSKNAAARQKAEAVAYQVMQIYREALQKSIRSRLSNGRILASTSSVPGKIEDLRQAGTMGMDPWGQPYRYRILSKASLTDSTQILVWSAGPNMKVESVTLETDQNLEDFQPNYSGDDLGVILKVSQN